MPPTSNEQRQLNTIRRFGSVLRTQRIGGHLYACSTRRSSDSKRVNPQCMRSIATTKWKRVGTVNEILDTLRRIKVARSHSKQVAGAAPKKKLIISYAIDYDCKSTGIEGFLYSPSSFDSDVVITKAAGPKIVSGSQLRQFIPRVRTRDTMNRVHSLMNDLSVYSYHKRSELIHEYGFGHEFSRFAVSGRKDTLIRNIYLKLFANIQRSGYPIDLELLTRAFIGLQFKIDLRNAATRKASRFEIMRLKLVVMACHLMFVDKNSIDFRVVMRLPMDYTLRNENTTASTELALCKHLNNKYFYSTKKLLGGGRLQGNMLHSGVSLRKLKPNKKSIRLRHDCMALDRFARVRARTVCGYPINKAAPKCRLVKQNGSHLLVARRECKKNDILARAFSPISTRSQIEEYRRLGCNTAQLRPKNVKKGANAPIYTAILRPALAGSSDEIFSQIGFQNIGQNEMLVAGAGSSTLTDPGMQLSPGMESPPLVEEKQIINDIFVAADNLGAANDMIGALPPGGPLAPRTLSKSPPLTLMPTGPDEKKNEILEDDQDFNLESQEGSLLDLIDEKHVIEPVRKKSWQIGLSKRTRKGSGNLSFVKSGAIFFENYTSNSIFSYISNQGVPNCELNANLEIRALRALEAGEPLVIKPISALKISRKNLFDAYESLFTRRRLPRLNNLRPRHKNVQQRFIFNYVMASSLLAIASGNKSLMKRFTTPLVSQARPQYARFPSVPLAGLCKDYVVRRSLIPRAGMGLFYMGTKPLYPGMSLPLKLPTHSLYSILTKRDADDRAGSKGVLLPFVWKVANIKKHKGVSKLKSSLQVMRKTYRYLDSTIFRNLFHYINTNNVASRNNITIRKKVSGNFYFVVKQFIAPGSELYVSYGGNYVINS